MTDLDERFPGIYGEGGYLPRLTEAAAIDLLWNGAGKTQTAAWIGDVERLAPWRKIVRAAMKKAGQK